MPQLKISFLGRKRGEQDAASPRGYHPFKDKTMRPQTLRIEDQQRSQEPQDPPQVPPLEEDNAPTLKAMDPKTFLLDDTSDGIPEDPYKLGDPSPNPPNQQQKPPVRRKQVNGDPLRPQSSTDKAPVQVQATEKEKQTTDRSTNLQSPNVSNPSSAPRNEQSDSEDSEPEEPDEESASETEDQHPPREGTLQSSRLLPDTPADEDTVSFQTGDDTNPNVRANELSETYDWMSGPLDEKVEKDPRVIMMSLVHQQNALQSKLSKRERTIERLRHNMAIIEQENTLLRDQRTLNEQALKELEEAKRGLYIQQDLDKKTILALEGQSTAHKQDITRIERLREDDQQTILALDTQIGTAEATIKDLESTLNAKDAAIHELKTQRAADDKRIAALDSQLKTAMITNQDLESELQKNKKKVEDLQSQCQTHEQKIAAINRQHAEARKKIQDLESQGRSAEERIKDLKGKVNAGEKTIQEVRSQHGADIVKLKEQHKLDVQKLVQQHAGVIRENDTKHAAELTKLNAQHAEKAKRLEEERQSVLGVVKDNQTKHATELARLKAQHIEKTESLEKERLATLERLEKQHEQQRVALTDEHQREVEQLQKQQQDLEAKMQRLQSETQSRLKQAEAEREELQRTHQTALHDQAEDFEAQKGDLARQHDRATLDLRRQVQELNAALIARDEDLYSASVFNVQGLPEDTDSKLKAHFVEIEQLVDSLGRLPWLDGSKVGSDRDLQPLVGKHGLRIVKKAIMQDLVWCVLFQNVFASPFRIFGEEGRAMESQWVAHCGQGTSDNTDTYIWPKPGVRAERWRYMTLTKCKEILKEPLSQWDARASIKKGFGDSMTGLRSELRETLLAVVGVTAETSAKIERLAKVATLKWLDFQLHRCRIVIEFTGSGTVSLPDRISEIRNGGITLTVLPKVGRYGNNKGTDLELYTLISGSKGESLELAQR